MQSRNDQKKNEKDDVANCTKDVICTKNVNNALTCCAKSVSGIENDNIENDGFENEETGKAFTVNKTAFDVQFMKVDVKGMKIKNDNAVAS